MIKISDIATQFKLWLTGKSQINVLMLMIMALSFGIFSLILIAYIGLIPVGHWQDEFITLPSAVDQGWKAFFLRVSSRSPRPFSELLIFAYAHVVDRYRSPLIGSALAVLWLMLTVSVLIVPAMGSRVLSSATSMWQCLVLSLGLYCLMLVGHPVGEFFYWPQGAAAYIPAVAGLCATMWVLIIFGTCNNAARWSCSVMLVVTALSAEVGAMFVVVLGLLFLANDLIDNRLRTSKLLPKQKKSWLVVPFVIAATVLIAIRFSRYDFISESILGNAKVARQIIPALLASVPVFLRELTSSDGDAINSENGILGLLTKALFFIAAYGILRPVVLRKNMCVDIRLVGLFSVACFATAFLTTAAAFFQFGDLCCERHSTFRQCLLFIALMSAAAFLAGQSRSSPAGDNKEAATISTVACLMTAILIPTAISAPNLLHEYENYDKYLQVNVQNWKAGRASGDKMVYVQLPPGKIVGGVVIPDGIYTLTDDSGWFIHSIISFFHKKSITFKTDSHTTKLTKPIRNPPAAFLAPLKQSVPQCVVDRLNDRPFQDVPMQLHTDRTLKMQGWTAPAPNAESESMSTWIVVSSLNGQKYYFKAVAEKRLDVVSALSRPALKNAGFNVILDLSTIPDNLTINLLSVSQGVAFDCKMAIQAY